MENKHDIVIELNHPVELRSIEALETELNRKKREHKILLDEIERILLAATQEREKSLGWQRRYEELRLKLSLEEKDKLGVDEPEPKEVKERTDTMVFSRGYTGCRHEWEYLQGQDKKCLKCGALADDFGVWQFGPQPKVTTKTVKKTRKKRGDNKR